MAKGQINKGSNCGLSSLSILTLLALLPVLLLLLGHGQRSQFHAKKNFRRRRQRVANSSRRNLGTRQM